MLFSTGDVVLTPFHASGALRYRPAVIVSNNYYLEETGHYVLAMITACGKQQWRSDVNIVNYRAAGLETPCFVRMKLMTRAQETLTRKIGALDQRDFNNAAKTLRSYFTAMQVEKPREYR